MNYSWTHTISYFAKKTKKVTERTNQILDTLPADYTQQAFTDTRYVSVCVQHLLEILHDDDNERE